MRNVGKRSYSTEWKSEAMKQILNWVTPFYTFVI